MKASELMAGVSGDPKHVAMFYDIAVEMEKKENDWVAMLRQQGVKAAHPDDGWIDREENSLTFCYPQFNDGAKVGDTVALGQPPSVLPLVDKGPTYRLVRLTQYKPSIFGGGGKFYFEAL